MSEVQSIRIQGVDFDAPAPYAAGQEINEPEAATLNQTLAENLRNNFAAKVKAAKETNGDNLSDEVIAGLRADFATYADSYEFHGRRATRAPVDPVKREATKIAKSIVLAALRQKKIETKSLPEGKLEELVEGVIGRQPQIMEEAKRRVEASKNVATDALDGLLN